MVASAQEPVSRVQYPVQTPFGVVSAPASGRVAGYVRSTGTQDGDDGYIDRNMNATLNAALDKCRAGRGDTVYVLPGHVEDISAADFMSNLKAGTIIVCLGTGANRPTFTWTITLASWLLDVADVTIIGGIFRFAGPTGTTALTVTAPMTISAAGCRLEGCEFLCEIDADQGATIALTTTADADDLTIQNCLFYGSTNGTLPTTYLRVVGADRLQLVNNTFYGATSAVAVGVVQFLTTASPNIRITGNRFTNAIAAAEHAVTAMAGITGFESDNTYDPATPMPTPQDLGLAAGAKIASFVDSTAANQLINLRLLNHRFDTTLNAGIAEARASSGDAVVMMPGHAETFDTADHLSALIAGTRMIGMGIGSLRPTLTWTDTDTTVLFNVANVTFENVILTLATSANSGEEIVAPITVSAAGCQILDCRINYGDDVNDIVTIGITVTAADFQFHRNHAVAATAAPPGTSFMDLDTATGLKMYDNVIEGAASGTGVGLVRFVSTASLNVDLQRNSYLNRLASSTCAVTGLAAVSGVSRDEHFHYLDTTSLTAWLTSTGIMTFYNPRVTNTAGETGSAVVGVVSA